MSKFYPHPLASRRVKNGDEVFERQMSGYVSRTTVAHHAPCPGVSPCECDPIVIDDFVYPPERHAGR